LRASGVVHGRNGEAEIVRVTGWGRVALASLSAGEAVSHHALKDVLARGCPLQASVESGHVDQPLSRHPKCGDAALVVVEVAFVGDEATEEGGVVAWPPLLFWQGNDLMALLRWLRR
jgi:hypothetical protein